ncbi:MAG: diguanylate cyclase, partial [Pseudohongiellaceae bacterium]
EECSISVSIGISLFPLDGEDEQTLIGHADEAMYAAKQKGKNSFRFYSVGASPARDGAEQD